MVLYSVLSTRHSALSTQYEPGRPINRFWEDMAPGRIAFGKDDVLGKAGFGKSRF
jgi:hypothetical protein